MQNQLVFPFPARRPARPITQLACVLGALTLTFSACEKAAEDAAPAAAGDAGRQQLVAMGFKHEHIEDKGTYFLVEGDIVFDKSQLQAAAAPATRPGTVIGQQNQISLNSLIRYDKQPNITVRIDPSVPTAWRGDVAQAIADWNSIPNARVDLTLTDASSADITVRVGDLEPGVGGTGAWAWNGNPGDEVILARTLSDANRRSIIVHEFGHNMGFKHTNRPINSDGVNGTVVPGTPGVGENPDPNSVMNAVVPIWRGRDFTQYDVLAFQNMYPSAKNRLYSDEELRPNQELRSANGQYRLTLQPDGNLVLYRGSQALWASRTNGQPVTRCAMQLDGNLVLYGGDNRVYWASGTNGPSGSARIGSSLAMQDDGNLVLYDIAGYATWATGTNNATFSRLIQAETFNNAAVNGSPNVFRENTTDEGGGQNVAGIDTDDWVVYENVTFPTSGDYRIEYRVASQDEGCQLSADLSAGAIQLGRVAVPRTGSWQNWTTVEHRVTVQQAGTYNFGLFAVKGRWNINWFRITKL